MKQRIQFMFGMDCVVMCCLFCWCSREFKLRLKPVCLCYRYYITELLLDGTSFMIHGYTFSNSVDDECLSRTPNSIYPIRFIKQKFSNFLIFLRGDYFGKPKKTSLWNFRLSKKTIIRRVSMLSFLNCGCISEPVLSSFNIIFNI